MTDAQHPSSTQRRRVPAGHAIAVVLLSLLITALLDADSLVASIDQQPFGTSRSVALALARPVRTVSHWTGLDLPLRLLNDLFNGSAKRRPAQIAIPPIPLPPALTRRSGARPGPLPTTGPTQGTGPIPTTATAPLAPRRVPTPAQPLRIWMAGDSLMGSVAESFTALANAHKDITVANDVQIGTGLDRPDVYNWPAAVGQEMAKANPDVVVFMFGANDDQNLVVGGKTLPRFTDAWRQEYARRISQVMALAATDGRQVIWLSVPEVKRTRLDQTKNDMNKDAQLTAPLFTNVTYVDSGRFLNAPNGSYTAYLNNSSGQPVKVREDDGIHFTLAGADRLTPTILALVVQFWRLAR